MNATEQIALLRRACEIAADLDDSKLSSDDFYSKWRNPEDVRDGDTPRSILRRALATTATPPGAAKPEPEFKAEGLRVYQRTKLWSEIASCRTDCTAKDIADALNGGKP